MWESLGPNQHFSDEFNDTHNAKQLLISLGFIKRLG